MNIQTKRLAVRNLTLEDCDKLFSVLSDAAVMAYIEAPFDYDKTVDFIKTCALCEPPKVYGIFLKANNELIGHLIFHLIRNDSYELGWIIAQRHWGNGYAGELTESVINYAKRKHISKLIIECDKRQTVTKHIAEKFGFVFTADEDNLSVYELELNIL